MTTTQPIPILTEQQLHDLETGALRDMLTKLASCLPEELDECQHTALALLAVTSAGQDTYDRILGYQLAIQQQQCEIRELQVRLAHALDTFDCDVDLSMGYIGAPAFGRFMKRLRRTAVNVPAEKLM